MKPPFILSIDSSTPRGDMEGKAPLHGDVHVPAGREVHGFLVAAGAAHALRVRAHLSNCSMYI